ncbi:MAG: pseudouridine synthase [Betaproteobacteria bacterium]
MSARAKRRAPPSAAPGREATQKLHKILAQAGLGSRRTMEEWIRAGRVTVNGAAAGIGTRVTSRDVIRVGRRVVRWPAPQRLPRIVLYHKPEGEIVSRDDPQERATVFDRLPKIRGGKWLAVGRLDYNTGGLLVFTTGGELANRMMHPRFAVEREYAVRLLGQLRPDQIDHLKSGVQLDDGPARCLSVEDGGGEGRNHWYRIVLAEGRNRVVRRMFEALGMTVSRLMRVRFGSLPLPPRLKRGQWLEMAPQEVSEFLRGLNARSGTSRGHPA